MRSRPGQWGEERIGLSGCRGGFCWGVLGELNGGLESIKSDDELTFVGHAFKKLVF